MEEEGGGVVLVRSRLAYGTDADVHGSVADEVDIEIGGSAHRAELRWGRRTRGSGNNGESAARKKRGRSTVFACSVNVACQMTERRGTTGMSQLPTRTHARTDTVQRSGGESKLD